MKRIIWSLVIVGIVGSFISIFFFGEHPVVMVGFFGFYLLLIYALFTYYFENIRDIKDKNLIPMLIREKKLINR